jgi:hypothetical protein
LNARETAPNLLHNAKCQEAGLKIERIEYGDGLVGKAQ